MQEAIYVDAAIAVLLLASGALSARAGFAKALLSILAWILAAALTILFLPYVEQLERMGKEPAELDHLITGGILFTILLVILMLAAYGMGRWFERGDVGVMNRVFGFLFGLLRGAFLLSAIYLVASLLYPPRDFPDWIQQARATPIVAEGAAMLTWLAPERVDAFKETLEESRRRAEEAVREEHRKKRRQRSQ